MTLVVPAAGDKVVWSPVTANNRPEQQAMKPPETTPLYKPNPLIHVKPGQGAARQARAFRPATWPFVRAAAGKKKNPLPGNMSE